MKKLLILLLIALIFGSILCDLIDECQKASCADVKKMCEKYGIYDALFSAFQKGSKKIAQTICEKKLPSNLCDCIIRKVWICL